MALDLFTPDGFCNSSPTSFIISISYSTKGRSNNTRSVPADIIFPASALPTLTLGDLNIHHPTADPLRVFREDGLATSTSYFDRVTELGFSLLHTLGVFPRFSMSLIGRPGVLDLAFACPLLAPYFTEWSDPLPSPSSDHIPILFRFEAPLFRALPPSPNLARPDWLTLESSLKSTAITHQQKDQPAPCSVLPSLCADVAGAYNVNFRSGCGHQHLHRPDVVGAHRDPPDATSSSPPQQPCALRTTLPSHYIPCTPLHATPFLISCDFNLLLPN